MKILHITPHMGGGVGTVIMDWMGKVVPGTHTVLCLDYANEKAMKFPCVVDNIKKSNLYRIHKMSQSDIVLVHYWDHPLLAEILSQPLPDCRLAFWVHKHYPISEKEVAYPDKCIGTSPIQFLPDYIWSTGDISRFLEIKPKNHDGFNIGTVLSPKLHLRFLDMCEEIKKVIPDARFTMLGNHNPNRQYPDYYNFVGKVDDVAPYLAEMDVFGYPLRPDHYGTCEQVLGEAMAAGVVPVVMDNPCEKLIYSGCKSESEYIEGIQFLYRSPGSRKVLSEICRERAKEIYSLDTMISQWDDVFEDMMEQPKKKRGML